MMSLSCLGLNNSLTIYTYSQKKLVVVKRVSGVSRNLVNLKLHKGTNRSYTRHDFCLVLLCKLCAALFQAE